MLVISLDYKLSTDGRHLWDRTELEIGCGLAWVADHAARFGGDPGRVVVFGDSAGGNLAINASYRASAGRLHSSCGGVPLRVQAVIASYPVIDPASFYLNDDPLLGNASRSMAGRYTGGSPYALPNRYAAIASSGAINAAAPPTLILVPETDHLVPPAASLAFAGLALSAGVRVDLVSVPHADHAFDAGPSGSLGNQIFRAASLRLLESTHVLPR